MTARTFARDDALAVLLDLIRLPPATRLDVWRSLPTPARRAVEQEWWWQAHGGQVEPAAAANGAPWRVWAIVAGRGFGKTRAGAEWVWARVREGTVTRNCPHPLRIALVAASLDEVERVMVRGESGLLRVARSGEHPRWIASRGVLELPSGAEAHAFTAEKPDKLRGPQHHYAWCDELAKWPRNGDADQSRAQATWNNLMLGLRLGARPRTIVTTTPRPVPLLRRVLALPRCVETRGRTAENPHSAADFRAAMAEMYAGTRLARQELDGELLEDFEGALWTRELIEKARILPGTGRWQPEGLTEGAQHLARLPLPGREGPGVGASGARFGAATGSAPAASGRLHADPPPPPPLPGGEMRRIVLGLDPPASTDGDSCGIVVCGKDEEGIAWVLADLTRSGLSPEAWARRVAEAAQEWGQLYTGVPAKVVAEKNQGGDMIASVLRAVDADLPLRLVPATKSKAARAEPIALRFESGRARLAGRFPELEDQLCALTWSGYHGPGSPDRLDAMVWAMTELFEKEPAEPRIRTL